VKLNQKTEHILTSANNTQKVTLINNNTLKTILKERYTEPGLIALYDIRPGNGSDLFLQPWSLQGDDNGKRREGKKKRCVRLDLGELQDPRVGLDSFEQVTVDQQPRRGHLPRAPAASAAQLDLRVAARQTSIVGIHHVVTLHLRRRHQQLLK